MSTDVVKIVCDRGAWHDGHKPRVLATFARSNVPVPEVPETERLGRVLSDRARSLGEIPDMGDWHYMPPTPKNPSQIDRNRLVLHPTVEKRELPVPPYPDGVPAWKLPETPFWLLSLKCRCGWPYMAIPIQCVVPWLDAASARGDDSVSVSDVFRGLSLPFPLVFEPATEQRWRDFEVMRATYPREARELVRSDVWDYPEDVDTTVVVMCDGTARRRGRGHYGRLSQVVGVFAHHQDEWSEDVSDYGNAGDFTADESKPYALEACTCGRTDRIAFDWDEASRACDRLRAAGITAVSMETFQHAVQAVRNGR